MLVGCVSAAFLSNPKNCLLLPLCTGRSVGSAQEGLPVLTLLQGGFGALAVAALWLTVLTDPVRSRTTQNWDKTAPVPAT